MKSTNAGVTKWPIIIQLQLGNWLNVMDSRSIPLVGSRVQIPSPASGFFVEEIGGLTSKIK